MCDRLQPTKFDEDGLLQVPSQKYEQALESLKKTGCNEINDQLSACLEQNERSWRACKQ